jgi:hypothetical protein
MPVSADLGYALPNDWDRAKRRFELLAACHDAASRRRAAALGVGPGWRCLDAGAGEGSFARWLAQQVGERGLTDVDAESQVQLFRGGSDPAEFWRLTWLQARERAVAIGAAVEDLDRGHALLADPERWFHGPAMVAAWGWRPSAE